MSAPTDSLPAFGTWRVPDDPEDCPSTHTLPDGYVVRCEAPKGHPKYHVCEVTYRWYDEPAEPSLAAQLADSEGST